MLLFFCTYGGFQLLVAVDQTRVKAVLMIPALLEFAKYAFKVLRLLLAVARIV